MKGIPNKNGLSVKPLGQAVLQFGVLKQPYKTLIVDRD